MTRVSEQPPDVNIAGLSIWIQGRQFPVAKDYWDGNWLNIVAVCEAGGAKVKVQGPYIHLSEIDEWLKGLIEMQSTLAGEAKLECIEPNLKVTMSTQSLGHISTTVEITPDLFSQHHSFEFETDQSYLTELIVNITNILKKYSLIGKP